MDKRPANDRLFSYTGRATRRELGAVFLASGLVLILSAGLVALAWDKWIGDAPFSDDFAESAVSRLIILFDLIPVGGCLATASRRLHDTGKSAFWLAIGVLPVIVARDIVGVTPANWSFAVIVAIMGAVALLVLLSLPGEAGQNAYGPTPRAADAAMLRRVFS